MGSKKAVKKVATKAKKTATKKVAKPQFANRDEARAAARSAR